MILTQVGVLGGMRSQVAVVYGLGALAFGIADMSSARSTASPHRSAQGLEVLLLRPHRCCCRSRAWASRCAASAGSRWAWRCTRPLSRSPASADPHLLLAVLAPLAGALLFGALFTIAGALQFWLIDGREFANAFTYGGNYVATTPGAVFALPMRAFFTFVVPATLVAYAPTLALLGLPGPALIPAWSGWLGLPAAVLAWIVAGRSGAQGSAIHRSRWMTPIPPPSLPLAPGRARGGRARRVRRDYVVRPRPGPAADGAGGARGRRLSLRIAPGETVGFVGANGAGKSTTIKMMTGILQPTSGSGSWADPVPERRPARASGWSSASAPSCGGICRCGTATASWARCTVSPTVSAGPPGPARGG